MKKKLLTLLLALGISCACAGLVGCNGSSWSDNAGTNTQTPDGSDGTTGGVVTGGSMPDVPSEGLAYTLINDGTEYEVSNIGSCTDTEIVIPETYNGLPVTSIGGWAFEGETQITRIVIPSTMESIGTSAFEGCDKLIEVVNKSSLTITTGDSGNGGVAVHAKQVITDTADSNIVKQNGYTFYNDNGNYYLIEYTGTNTRLVLPDTILGNSYAIYTQAFRERENITSVTIGNNVTSIGDGAFVGCYNLTSVTIGNLVTSIGDEAFAVCRLTAITIPNSVTSIGAFAFEENRFTEVKIPNSVTNIGRGAFGSCEKLTNIQVDKTNPNYKSVDGNLYSKDGKTLIQYAIGKTATSFTIPDGVETIGKNAFKDCDYLTSIIISDGVINISGWAFYSCSNLTSIVIPNSVTNIEAAAAFRLNTLREVYYTGTSFDDNFIETISNHASSDYNENLYSFEGSDFCPLYKAIWYYYSETQPTDTEGNYWHYVNGIPTAW